MRFKIVLSKRGQDIFKGGNIKPLSKMLFSFKAENLKKAKSIFYNKLVETLGSASENLFKVSKKY